MAADISMRHVALFDGTNYQSWKYQMQNVFVMHGIQDVVLGTRTIPANRTSAEGTTWLKDDAKAKFVMSSTMDPRQLENILSCDASKEVWDRLKAIHEQQSESNKLLLSQRFHEYRMDPNDSVVQHVSKVQNMARSLLDLGQNLSDVQIMAKILVSLPSKYHTFRSSWNSVQPDRQTIEHLQYRLIEEESFLDVEKTEVTALAATTSKVNGMESTSKRKYKPRYGKSKKNVQCYVCKQKGHYARECPTNEREDSNSGVNKNSTRSSALVATHKSSLNVSRVSDWEPSIGDKRLMLSVDNEKIWIGDSGASTHITHRRDWFSNFRPRRDGSTIVLGDDRECEVQGEGTVVVEALVDGMCKETFIENVVYTPGFKRNLFSVGQCFKKGMHTNFSSDGVKVIRDGFVVAHGVMQSDDTFRMFFRPRKVAQLQANTATTSLKTWHERLGHLNERALKHLTMNNLVNGVAVKDVEQTFFCDACQFGKSHRLPFTKDVVSNMKPGEFIHSDVCGPMPVMSLGGASYFVTFKDDASVYCRVYFMKHKSDVVDCVIAFGNEIKNQFGRPMKRFRSDNGKEYANGKIKEYLISQGTIHEFSAP